MILIDVNNKSSYFHSPGVGNTILLGNLIAFDVSSVIQYKSRLTI